MASETTVVQSPWIGHDTPEAPTGVAATVEDGTRTVTFEPVTQGVHGGYIDVDGISYTVSRNGVVFTTGLKGAPFTDTEPGLPFAVYRYSFGPSTVNPQAMQPNPMESHSEMPSRCHSPPTSPTPMASRSDVHRRGRQRVRSLGMQCRRRMHQHRPRSLRCLGVHPAAYDAERRMRTGRAGFVPDSRESREPRRLPMPRRSVAAFRIGYRDNHYAARRRGHVHNTQLQLHRTEKPENTT